MDENTTPKHIYEIEAECPHTGARAGYLHTGHGTIPTPVFMPVGTRASVKGVSMRELDELGANIILGNTYHLYLRPGHETIARFGGLHGFSSWSKPILTDSGGFQVYSLAESRRITEDGVEFRSVLDGSRHFLSPEYSIEIQYALGADIIMAFDECAASWYSESEARFSTDRTHRWLDRSIAAHERLSAIHGRKPLLFSIIQGGIFPELKKESARYCTQSRTDGIAIGGDLRIETDPEFSYGLIDTFMSMLPREKPRYFMGVGAPDNLVESVARGVDMFDCVYPTRMARHGVALSRHGNIRIASARYRESREPLDPRCDCFVCRTYSRGYLRHLLNVGEQLGASLVSYHNLYVLLKLARDMRKAIVDGVFPEFLETYRRERRLYEITA